MSSIEDLEALVKELRAQRELKYDAFYAAKVALQLAQNNLNYAFAELNAARLRAAKVVP